MIDILNARNEASAMFQSAWNAADWSLIGLASPPLIKWDGINVNDADPSPTTAYARFTYSPSYGAQGSLADGTGKKLWDEAGLIMVQSFGPLAGNKGLEIAEYMAIIGQRVYQGKSSPNGMWFRNCRVSQIGPSGAWYQYNTIVEFEYNQLR